MNNGVYRFIFEKIAQGGEDGIPALEFEKWPETVTLLRNGVLRPLPIGPFQCLESA